MDTPKIPQKETATHNKEKDNLSNTPVLEQIQPSSQSPQKRVKLLTQRKEKPKWI
jgi:hypothetical protein